MRKTMKRLIAPLLALALAGIGSTAQAALIVYTNQASFLSAVSAPGFDNYTGFNINGLTSSPIVRTAGAYGYSASAPTGFYGAGTTANPWLSTNTDTDVITFYGFTSGVSAIGGNFFGSNINGSFRSGNITLVATDSAGFVSQTIANATTTSFLGFVSTTSLQSLSVTAMQGAGNFWPTVDNLVLASSLPSSNVPEPASMALLGLGMVSLALSRRKKKQS